MYWERGEITAVAKYARVSVSYFSDILHRRRETSPRRGKWLSAAVMAMTGKEIKWYEFCIAKYSNHSAFFGKPKV